LEKGCGEQRERFYSKKRGTQVWGIAKKNEGKEKKYSMGTKMQVQVGIKDAAVKERRQGARGKVWGGGEKGGDCPIKKGKTG